MGYPFKEANVIFKSDNVCLGNNLGKGSRCHTFGDGTIGTVTDVAIGWIFGDNNRNFEAKGNCNHFTVGTNNNSASFKTGVNGFTLGDNNSNTNVGSIVNDLVLGSNNINITIGDDVTGLGAWEGGFTDMSDIRNLHFGSNINCTADFTQPITIANNPELYGSDIEKWISNAGFDGVANAHYLHYYNGNTIAYQRVGSTPTGEKYAVKTVNGIEADNQGNVTPDGTIVELGTITYNDINSASASQDISIPLTTNNFPDSSYTVGLFYKINEPFDGSDNFNILDAGHNVLYELSESPVPTNYIGEYSASLIVRGLNSSSNEQYKDASFVAELALRFNVINSQDLTTGSVTIYAIVKPFPV